MSYSFFDGDPNDPNDPSHPEYWGNRLASYSHLYTPQTQEATSRLLTPEMLAGFAPQPPAPQGGMAGAAPAMGAGSPPDTGFHLPVHSYADLTPPTPYTPGPMPVRDRVADFKGGLLSLIGGGLLGGVQGAAAGLAGSQQGRGQLFKEAEAKYGNDVQAGQANYQNQRRLFDDAVAAQGRQRAADNATDANLLRLHGIEQGDKRAANRLTYEQEQARSKANAGTAPKPLNDLQLAQLQTAKIQARADRDALDQKNIDSWMNLPVGQKRANFAKMNAERQALGYPAYDIPGDYTSPLFRPTMAGTVKATTFDADGNITGYDNSYLGDKITRPEQRRPGDKLVYTSTEPPVVAEAPYSTAARTAQAAIDDKKIDNARAERVERRRAGESDRDYDLRMKTFNEMSAERRARLGLAFEANALDADAAGRAAQAASLKQTNDQQKASLQYLNGQAKSWDTTIQHARDEKAKFKRSLIGKEGDAVNAINADIAEQDEIIRDAMAKRGDIEKRREQYAPVKNPSAGLFGTGKFSGINGGTVFGGGVAPVTIPASQVPVGMRGIGTPPNLGALNGGAPPPATRAATQPRHPENGQFIKASTAKNGYEERVDGQGRIYRVPVKPPTSRTSASARPVASQKPNYKSMSTGDLMQRLADKYKSK